MKPKISITLLFAGLTSFACAIPSLQLDITTGVFDSGTETTIATENPFTLRALINPSKIDLARNFYIAAAITPKVTTENFGSFLVNGIAYSASLGNMQYGTPPVDDLLKDLAGHDIYDTWYAEIPFSALGSGTVAAYNVQDGSSAPGYLNYVDFNVNIAGLAGQPNSLYSVHFDLYTYDAIGSKIDFFAPFSHDAQSSHGITIHDNPVPDGGTTLVLLGSAMSCMGLFRRLISKA